MRTVLPVTIETRHGLPALEAAADAAERWWRCSEGHPRPAPVEGETQKLCGCPARDGVFDRWVAEDLVWLPGRGMGFYPVASSPYDQAYFDKYAAYRGSEIEVALNRARVALVDLWLGAGAPVVDIGIGDGAFIESRSGPTYGFDVNPAGLAWLDARGLLRDPYAGPVDAVTLWDALEHIHDPAPLLANVERYVFVSLPIVPGDGPPRADWKHFRPDEHCWYWTRRGFIGWMAEHGFECVEHNTAESLAGREDIETFVLRRVA